VIGKKIKRKREEQESEIYRQTDREIKGGK